MQGQRLAAQRMGDEAADHPAIAGPQARAVGVEQARHARSRAVLPGVGHHQRLGAALALVVRLRGPMGLTWPQ
jgi:hypothetical protein